jgi:nucleotide-binding universal stress UspA family protein
MKTILVPTDFSYCALQAVRAAVQLAKTTQAKVVVLHNVYTETKWTSLPSARRVDYPETLAKIKDAENRMNLLMKSDLLRKVNVTNLITYGVADEEIVSQSKQLKADVIVIGSHGNEVADRYFIGSTVQKVLRNATCPVLTIQNNYKPRTWKKLAFATDFDKDTYKHFEKIKKIALDLNASLYLLYVNLPSDFMDTRAINKLMDNFIAKYPEMKIHKVIYNHIDPAEGILQFIEDYPMDLIALITRWRPGKPKYMIGHTETLAFRSDIPVLSVNILPAPLK